MDRTKKTFWTVFAITAIVTILPAFIGLYYKDRMPEQVAIHFDAAGNPNQFMSRSFAIWLVPLIILGVHVICSLIYYFSFQKVKTESMKKMLTGLQWIMPEISCGSSYPVLASALGMEVNVPVFILLLTVAIIVICILASLPVIREQSRQK